jgi:hypothetical protein
MAEEKYNLSQSELEQIKEGLKRTYKERFEMGTCLYKIRQTMKKATITHKPFKPK